MKHPAIGKLYALRLAEDVLVHLTPVEFVRRGFFNGTVVCYVFKPELTSEQLYADGGPQDLLIPAVITLREYFKDSSLEYIDSLETLAVPFFSLHLFIGDGSGLVLDVEGNELDSVPTDAHRAPRGLYFLTGICKLIGEKLNVKLNCDGLERNLTGSPKRKSDPSDDFINKESIHMIIGISGDADACTDPDQDIAGIEDALMQFLGNGKRGLVTGTGLGESTSDIHVMIYPGEYPEAIKGIRKALNEVGVHKFAIHVDR